MREGVLALGRLLGAPPGAWGLPVPGPGPQPSSDEPDSRGGWSLPTLPRASSASSLCCRPLMTLFSDLVSPHGDVQLSLRARGDPGNASHLALARVYLALEELDPPAEVDNPPPGGIRVAVPWWVVGVPRGSSRRAYAGSARSRGSSPARWSASRGSTWWASSRGS